ncbi:MAG: OmpA family protein [Pseudomonadota bacterium]
MKILTKATAVIGFLALGACTATPGEDYGFDSKKLTSLTASIWVDPNGCEHWVVDDGAEGYLVARRDRGGNPVCRGNSSTPDLPVLSLASTIWTDPRGCQHWAIDDGAEGFLSERLARDGTPVCPGADKPEPPKTFTLAADALFDTDKSNLRPEAITELNDFGSKMNQLGKKRVFIVGHTDSRASDAYNQRLSERRAASVAAYLEKNYGIVSQTEGRGENEPVGDNGTRDGRQANRRVEITLLD